MLRILRTLRKLHLEGLLRTTSSAHVFTEYFKGFEKIEVVRRILGEKTDEILHDLKVEFTWVGGYMWVNVANGHLVMNTHYLNNGNKIDIYLDIIHELVHIRQHMEGKKLFDENYDYVDRPTEIEAYQVVVKEARSLGLTDERICEYLRTEWMSAEDLKRLAKTLGVRCGVHCD